MTMSVRSRLVAVTAAGTALAAGLALGGDRVGVGGPQLRLNDHGCQRRHGPARWETRREGTPHTPPGGCAGDRDQRQHDHVGHSASSRQMRPTQPREAQRVAKAAQDPRLASRSSTTSSPCSPVWLVLDRG